MPVLSFIANFRRIRSTACVTLQMINFLLLTPTLHVGPMANCTPSWQRMYHVHMYGQRRNTSGVISANDWGYSNFWDPGPRTYVRLRIILAAVTLC